MELLTYEEKERVFEEAAKAVNAMLERQFGGPLLFLISGGSSLGLLDSIRPEFLGSHMTIAVSDERFSTDPQVNNLLQAKSTSFFRHANERGCAVIDTLPYPEEKLEEFGKRFDAALKDWRTKNPNGSVVMTQGVGPDGHTCGIMPFPHDRAKFSLLFENKEVWAVGYDAHGKNEYPLRVTVTLPFLREQVVESVVYAVGGSKKTALENIMKKEGEFYKVPAFILREMKNVTVFTDQKI